MTTERLSIEVSETGTRTVKREIESIGTTAKATEGPIAALKGAIAGLTTAVNQINTTLGSMNSSLAKVRPAAQSGASAVGQLGSAAQRGAGQVGGLNQEVKKLPASLKGAESGLGFLKRALQALATGVVINQLKELVDTYTVIQNKLRLVTEDQGNLNAVFARLQQISTDTRSSLEDNVSLYSRLALSARELGYSQEEVLQFTKSLNQAIKLSGATTVEASNGLIQLSQGLASGTLRGDELRSVLEQLPAVADVIASGLGVTRGQLRRLGEQGKITADQIFEAFKKAQAVLEKDFGKTVPTIAEGFVMLKNQLTVTIGAIFDAANGGEALGGVFVSVTTFIKDSTAALVDFTRAITGTLDPTDKLSNNAKVLATALIGVWGVLKTISSFISSTALAAFKAVGNTLGGISTAIVQALRGNFAEAGTILKETFKDVGTQVMVDGTAIKNALVDDAKDTVRRLVEVWDEGSRKVQTSRAASGEVSTKRGPKANITNAAEEKAMMRLQRQLEQLLDKINPIPGALMEMERARETLTKAHMKGLLTDEQLQENLERLELAYKDILDPLGRVNREMDEEIMLLGLNSRERELQSQVMAVTQSLLAEGVILTEAETDALREKLLVMQDLNEVTEQQDKLMDQSIGKRREFVTQLQAIQALLQDPASGFQKTDATDALADAFGEDMFANTAEQFEAQTERYRFMYEQIDMMRQADLISEQTAGALRAKVFAQSQAAQLEGTQNFLGQLSQLQKSKSKEASRIGKAAAIAQAVIDTYKAATAAYASLAGIPYVGPALGAAAAAAAIAAGMANVRAIRSQPTGYMKGGYTGDGPVNAVAGVVHRGEHVMDAASTKRLGAGNLESLRSGDAYIARRGQGGTGAMVGGAVKVNIQNFGTSKEFDVQQLSADEVRIIARDEARTSITREVPGLVASEIGNPNSRVSKSLGRNTSTARRR